MFRSFRFGRNIVCVYIYIQIVGSNKNNKKKKGGIIFRAIFISFENGKEEDRASGSGRRT